ncbi:hypothetical protein Nepgr_001086 [Nepenthes gracilis]|uniref:Uncharacterized protein n=1 Tax=Nepenthes gracilis TaxID=150966 RepID=A0AAD3P4P9_NEPGR|nr:hypothetical protein Nepgr_001086 [Nepenthes gracilis]
MQAPSALLPLLLYFADTHVASFLVGWCGRFWAHWISFSSLGLGGWFAANVLSLAFLLLEGMLPGVVSLLVRFFEETAGWWFITAVVQCWLDISVLCASWCCKIDVSLMVSPAADLLGTLKQLLEANAEDFHPVQLHSYWEWSAPVEFVIAAGCVVCAKDYQCDAAAVGAGLPVPTGVSPVFFC